MFGNGARRIALFTLALLAPCAKNTLFGQALNMDGQSGNFFQPSANVVPLPHSRFGAPITPDVGCGSERGHQPSL